VNWNKICNEKTGITSVTVLTQKTVTTCVTPSGVQARRWNDEDGDCASQTSRCLASAGLEQQ
jgi:hypothetical protein